MRQAVGDGGQVSGIHLLAVNADVVRRWSNEVQEAVNSKHPLVQASALAPQALPKHLYRGAAFCGQRYHGGHPALRRGACVALPADCLRCSPC